MDVPALYCGVAADVRKVARRQVRAYIRGAPWLEAIDGPMVSSADVPGLIYLGLPGFGGPSRRPHVYLYMPFLEVFRAWESDRLPPSCFDEIRECSLHSDWGAAAMLGGLCLHAFIRNPSCWPALARSSVCRWPVLDAEGARYAVIAEQGQRLWPTAFGLHFVLKGLGVGDYPVGRNVVFEPRSFLAEHGLLDRVLAATDHP